MADIFVAGSFMMDNVASMDVFPDEGYTVLGNSIELYPGGKGMNQCVSIARLGGNVEMAGMLGKDENARVLRKLLKDENIIHDFVFSCDKPTGVAQIQINAKGQNKICVIPSANYEFGYEHIKQAEISMKKCKLLVLRLELRLDVTEELIRVAHNYGVKVLLNPAPAARLDKDILAMIDYITPNEHELSILSDIPIDTDDNLKMAANKLLSLGVKNVIATLGSKGAMIVNSDGFEIINGYKVKAVDTVAAGDSFNGALALKIVEGKSLKEAVKFANAMGALTVTKKGAIPSIHRLKDVELFLSQNE